MRIIERTIFIIAIIGLFAYSWIANNRCARAVAERDRWQDVATRVKWNENLPMITEVSNDRIHWYPVSHGGKYMRQIAELKTGEKLVVWEAE